MGKTLVIGSTGQTHPLLQQSGLEVAALARNPAKLAGIDGIEIIEGDHEHDAGCDRVVFTAGQAPDRPAKPLICRARQSTTPSSTT